MWTPTWPYRELYSMAWLSRIMILVGDIIWFNRLAAPLQNKQTLELVLPAVRGIVFSCLIKPFSFDLALAPRSGV